MAGSARGRIFGLFVTLPLGVACPYAGTMAPKAIPVPDSIWRSLEALRADFLSKETVVARWEPFSVDVEVQNWARAVTASGALTAALNAVAAEDPELADQ